MHLKAQEFDFFGFVEKKFSSKLDIFLAFVPPTNFDRETIS